MNNMKQVAQMFGVELEQEFIVNNSNNIYKLSEDGLFYRSTFGEWYREPITLEWILTGKLKIIKKFKVQKQENIKGDLKA